MAVRCPFGVSRYRYGFGSRSTSPWLFSFLKSYRRLFRLYRCSGSENVSRMARWSILGTPAPDSRPGVQRHFQQAPHPDVLDADARRAYRPVLHR